MARRVHAARAQKARVRTARKTAHRIHQQKWAEGEKSNRGSVTDRFGPWGAAGRLLAVAGVAGFGVWGFAEPAQAVANGCASATAAHGATVAGLAYQWGMNWRSDSDVWQLALANPAIPNPNKITAGELIFQCATRIPAADPVGLVRYRLRAPASLAVLDAVQTGDGHWPIPIWHLAQANPADTWSGTLPAGTRVFLLPVPWRAPRRCIR